MIRVMFASLFYCVACCTLLTAPKFTRASEPFAEKVLIRIVKANTSIQQLFQLVQEQTPLNFAYDEKDVDLSSSIILPVGEHLLIDVLSATSRQTGLLFIQKKSVILVRKQAPMLSDCNYF